MNECMDDCMSGSTSLMGIGNFGTSALSASSPGIQDASWLVTEYRHPLCHSGCRLLELLRADTKGLLIWAFYHIAGNACIVTAVQTLTTKQDPPANCPQ